MISKFNLYRSLLNEKGQVGQSYRWYLEVRLEVEQRDHEDWYTFDVGTEHRFNFGADTYGQLAKEVFRRRGEIQPMLRVAESTAGLLWRSRLHFLSGLKSSGWFEDLMTVLGLLESFTANGTTHPEWIEWEEIPFSFNMSLLAR